MIFEKKLPILGLLNILFVAYILSFAVEKLCTVRTSLALIYLPELVFIPLGLVFLLLTPKIWHNRQAIFSEWLLFDSLVVAYFLIVLMAYIHNPNSNSLSELVGCGYMLSFYFIFNLTFRFQNQQVWLEKGIKLFILSGIIASVAAIISYFLGFMGVEKGVSQTFDYYPLTGGSLRAYGLIRNPIFLANYLICTLIVFVSYYFEAIKKLDVRFSLLLLLFITALILTKTKSILLAFAIGLYFVTQLWSVKRTLVKVLLSISLLSVMAYMVLSHFLIVDMLQPNLTRKLHAAYYFPQYIWAISDRYAIVPTFYYGTKRTALIAFYDFFPFGVGGDNLAGYSRQLVNQGRHLRAFCCAPHSTFLGALGELGILGFGLVIALFVKIWRMVSAIELAQPTIPRLHLMMKSFIFFLICEAVTVDLMNVRHFWLILATISLLFRMFVLQKKSTILTFE